MIENIPAEIVRRLLERGSVVAARTAARASEFAAARLQIREGIADLIQFVSDETLDSVAGGSISAVDGGLVCDAKSIGDLCSAVAVCVGPGDKDGDCNIWMDSVTRSPKNKEILSGIMSSMEVRLAAAAKADIVMIDGSMLSTMINVSKAVISARSLGGPLNDRLVETIDGTFRESLMTILSSPRFIAMPKYTTTNEFSALLPPEFRQHDARTVVTMALKPGEMTHFSVREMDDRDDGKRQIIGPSLGFVEAGRKEFSHALDAVVSCYYRPHAWTPAFRLDMTENALEDGEAQLRALRAVRDTTRTPGMREPFPLYLVDLFAKQVSSGTAPVVEMSALTSVTDPEAKLLLAMGYRT